MDMIYKQMKDDTELISEEPKGTSQIREFFNGQTIFLTGSTGFLGQSLVEKLLRSCPGINKIYTLVRPKRGVPTEERMKKYFDGIVFDKVRQVDPDFAKKVVTMEGDLLDPDLGLSPENRRRLCEETTIFIHNAASVNFALKISVALKINVLGTKKVTELAAECKNLKVFVYVSTGFSQAHESQIKETSYPPLIDLAKVEEIIEKDTATENGLSRAELNQLLGNSPNNYTFTKSIAESIVVDFSKKVQYSCVIFRPSIVLPAWAEPFAAWCSNFNGPVMPAIYISRGILHTAVVNKDLPVEIIPIDMTTNALLALIWDIATQEKRKENCSFYNYSSKKFNPVDLRTLLNAFITSIPKLPSINMVYYPFVAVAKSYNSFYILHLIMHVFPAKLVDFSRKIAGKPPTAMPLLLKQSKGMKHRTIFMNTEWDIITDNIVGVWDRMNAVDHAEFFSDVRRLNWDVFMLRFWPGVRRYLLNESSDTLPAARKKIRKLAKIHYTIITVLLLFLALMLYAIVSVLFS